MIKSHAALWVALGAWLSAGGIASADPLKVGDSLTYQFSITQAIPVNPALPKELAGQVKPFSGTTVFSFSLAVDRLDSDGSAHATISPHYGHMHIRGWSFPDFEGNVLSDGEVVAKCDEGLLKAAGVDAVNFKVAPGYQPKTQEEQVNFSACGFRERFSLFDDVALGAGRRAVFTDGDAWRIVIPDKADETIDFSYSGTASNHGHDVVTLALATTRTIENGPTPVNGTAYYDAVHHSLVELRYTGNVDTPQGPGLQTIDIVLQP